MNYLWKISKTKNPFHKQQRLLFHCYLAISWMFGILRDVFLRGPSGESEPNV